MAYLLDSGIILRLVDTKDARHTEVRHAVRTLGDQGQELFIATQNIAEFCNVATRPILNNGLGLQPTVAIELFEKDVEPICEVVVEKELVHLELKRLISTYSVIGKRRYEPEGIKIVTPAQLIASA
jgi:predicted nucleic acid-binding protein